MKKNDFVLNSLLLPLDFALLLAAAVSAYFVRVNPMVAYIRPVLFDISISYFMTVAALLSFLMVVFFALSGLYAMRSRMGILSEFMRISIAVSASFMVVIIFMFFNRAWFDSRFILLGAWMLAILFVFSGRILARFINDFFLSKLGIGIEHVMLIGGEEDVEKIEKQLERQNGDGFKILPQVGFPSVEVLEKLHNFEKLHHVIVLNPNINRAQVSSIVAFCEENGIQFSYVPDFFGSMVVDMHFDIIRGMPVVSVRPSPLDGWGRVAKRILDTLGAVGGFIILSPLFLLFSFLIKWESKGPIFVKLRRVSQGREFDLYKFRSMIDNAEAYKPYLMHLNERGDGPLFKMSEDPRITRFGKFLRKRRFDELPQLFNVLKGDVSLIGPRPHELSEIKKYKSHHKKVLAMKAGITGFAQINGASDLSFDEEVKLDRHYIENWSMKKDIHILTKTLWMLFFDKSGV